MSRLEELKNKLQQNERNEKEAQIKLEDEIDQWIFQLNKLYDHIEKLIQPLKEHGISTRQGTIPKNEYNKMTEAPIFEIKYRNESLRSDPTLNVMGLPGRCDFKQNNQVVLTLTPQPNELQPELNWAIFTRPAHKTTGRLTAQFTPLTDDEIISFLDKHLKI